jgi:hypothetical protein
MVSSSDVGNSESAIWHNFAEMELVYYMTEIDCRILNGVLSTTLKNHRKAKCQTSGQNSSYMCKQFFNGV